MKRLAAILFVLSGLFLIAAAPSQKAADISKFEGRVKIVKEGAVRGANVTENNTPVTVGNEVQTKRRSKAYLSLVDGSKVALDERSSIVFKGIKDVSPKSGKVLFEIEKQEGVKGVSVGLKTAVIGVKGTRFMVEVEDTPEGSQDEPVVNVFLKEGRLQVDSTDGDFKKYNEVVMDEFEAYKKKMTGEFDEYKKQLEEEFAEFVSGFEMKAGDSVSISGNEVRKAELTPEKEKLFDMLEDF